MTQVCILEMSSRWRDAEWYVGHLKITLPFSGKPVAKGKNDRNCPKLFFVFMIGEWGLVLL